MIKIARPYGLLMGCWSGIGTPTIFLKANKVRVYTSYYYANSLILFVILLLNKCILS